MAHIPQIPRPPGSRRPDEGAGASPQDPSGADVAGEWTLEPERSAAHARRADPPQPRSHSADHPPTEASAAHPSQAEPDRSELSSADERSAAADERSADDRSADERSADDRSADDRSADEHSPDERSAAERLAADRVAAGHSGEQRPAESRPADARAADPQLPTRVEPRSAEPGRSGQGERGRGQNRNAPAREPALMLPGSIVVLLLVLAGIQLVRENLGWQEDLTVLGTFAFIPARYADRFGMFPGGIGADAWTFLTYALLHGGWMHLVTNSVWLLAFGSAVARRFGALRFFIFFAVTAAAGAAVHLAAHFGEPVPVVGASAAIAGLMAAAARFVFEGRGPLTIGTGGDLSAFRRPARSLPDTLRNPRALFFVLMFFGLNLLTGVGSTVAGGVSIAWEAHIGGFLAGLLLFRAFDPVRARPFPDH